MASRPLVLAHTGSCRRAPGNSLEAFTLAREDGADGVELDVRRTADGVLVVHHDPEADGVGLLASRDFADVRAAAPRIPSLSEALDVLVGMIVNIEVKCLPWEPDADDERTVAAAVTAAVAERGLHEDVIISSFDLDAVDFVRSLDGRAVTGWLTMGQDPRVTLPIARARGHEWLHPDNGVLTAEAAPDAVRLAAEHGVKLDVWTVNDEDHIRALARAGVHALITDTPDVALAAITG